MGTDLKTAIEIEFKNEHLSVSRLKLFEKCARAFFFQYVSKGEREPFGGAAMFGVILHLALELLYTWVRDEEYEGAFPTDRLIGFYKDAWTAIECKAGVGVYQEGLDILRTYAKTHFRVSHWDVLAIEQEFNITIDGFKLNGYIDRVDRVNDTTIEVIDFKSNRMLFTKDELDNDLQMSIYGLACRELFPWAENVQFSFHMLRHDVHQNTLRTASVIDDAAGYVAALGRMTETEKDFKATPNGTCNYCDHRARCEAYKEMLVAGHEFTKLANDADFVTIVTERQNLAVLAKAAYGRKDTLDKLIKERLGKEGACEVGPFQIRTVSGGFDVKYENPQAVADTFFELAGVPHADTLRRVVRVDKDEVAEMQKELAPKLPQIKAYELEATLESIALRTPRTPRLDVRETKTANTAEKVAKKATSTATKRGKKTTGSAET